MVTGLVEVLNESGHIEDVEPFEEQDQRCDQLEPEIEAHAQVETQEIAPTNDQEKVQVSQIFSAQNSLRTSFESLSNNQALPNSMRNSHSEIGWVGFWDIFFKKIFALAKFFWKIISKNPSFTVLQQINQIQAQMESVLIESKSASQPTSRPRSVIDNNPVEEITKIASATQNLINAEVGQQENRSRTSSINSGPKSLNNSIGQISVNSDQSQNSQRSNQSHQSNQSNQSHHSMGSQNSQASNNSSEPQTFQDEMLNAEEIRQTALRSLADLRRSLIDAVAHSVASSENTLLESVSGSSQRI